MDCTSIPLNALPHTSRLFRDYVSHAPAAAGLFPHHYRDSNSYQEAARQVRYPDELRRSMVQLLTEQNLVWGASPARERNLSRLAQANCLTVVTGQQVGLFTGPAFAIYKALTAVKLAEHLSARGIEAVPIFWMATEDHDLAEVDHTLVQDRDGRPQTIRYPGEPAVADSPAGSLTLGDDIAASMELLRQMLPECAGADQVVEWLRAAYRPGATLGSAFGGAMAQLLGAFGVLTINPLDARVHRLTTQVFQQAAKDSTALRDLLLARNEQLIANGFHAQVRVGEQSTLLFAYEAGKRSILHSQGQNFVSSTDKKYSAGEIAKIAAESPEMLSPTALLRPVMQDALFPTVAYVGGPAEIAYLAQSAPLYERILGRMPVVAPRASVTLIDSPIQRLIGKYNLSLEDVFAGRQQLREKMAARFFSEDLTVRFASATESLEQQMSAIQQALQKLDPTLVDAAKNGAQKMLYQLTSLERKAAASVQGKNDQVERDATRLENAVYPEKAMQERIYCGASLLARYGLGLMDELYQAIPAIPVDHQILISS